MNLVFRLGLTLAALTALACNQPAPAPKVSATACEDWSKRLCKETGDDSPTCASVKSTAELLTPEACAAGLAGVDVAIKKLGDKRKKCDDLMNKLCKDIGESTATCEMVRTQTKKFPPDRCEMMLGRYDEVLADLKRQEAKNQPLGPEVLAKLVAGEPASYGPADAKVTVVEFSDFECPFCSRAATTLTQLKTKYGDKVHFVFRQFPLSFHKNAHVAAQASLAAKAQGKFWQLHDKMFEDQKKLDRESLEASAKAVGLDMAAFKKALDEKTYAPIVDADMKLGEEVAVDGTPTMFLNGKRVPNPTDVDAVSKQIDEALKAAGG
jgi:protein-disulfide isomerase